MDQVVLVGFGNIGQAVVPLLRRHFPGCRIVAIDQFADEVRQARSRELGVDLIHCRINKANYQTALSPYLQPGVFLLNLAPAVSSSELLLFAQSVGAFYLDTGIEPWAYTLTGDSIAATSNHALREQILELALQRTWKITALVAHGANPGFVSILVKRALLVLAQALEPGKHATPRTREQWADLADALDVRVIQISECDTQHARVPRNEGEFVNTWSVEGFVTECLQPVELGWGSHERRIPAQACQLSGKPSAAIQLEQRGHEIAVQTWTPMRGSMTACILTHNESLSIADYFTTRKSTRPTVYYAYRPCEDAIASLDMLDLPHAECDWHERVLKEELVEGIDELGVFVMSGRGRSVWLGSALSIDQARELAAHNNATSLQVVSSIIAGMQWMLDHPDEGIVESERLDHEATYERARPYWEPIQCVITSWQPEGSAGALTFDEFLLPGLTLAGSHARKTVPQS
ncbi:homospermidine synthase [Paraburkholderia sp. Tr-20389]|uniref:saccharopine dehydrogenase C-terminal domain-containing protein n=1 Tax=Paraburkholderia sp. Tr-20389 TaxID=2703903 RepID=UPI00197D3543|nr:homospermidine synthase [Paraburkholderia sp. Tr-20389]